MNITWPINQLVCQVLDIFLTCKYLAISHISHKKIQKKTEFCDFVLLEDLFPWRAPLWTSSETGMRNVLLQMPLPGTPWRRFWKDGSSPANTQQLGSDVSLCGSISSIWEIRWDFWCFFGLVLFGSWSKSEVVVGDNRGRLFTYEGGNSAKWSFCSMSWGVGERSNWFSLHGSYFLRWNRKPYVGKIIGWFALPVFYWSHGIIQNHWNISTHKKRMVQECSRMFIYIYFMFIYIID